MSLLSFLIKLKCPCWTKVLISLKINKLINSDHHIHWMELYIICFFMQFIVVFLLFINGGMDRVISLLLHSVVHHSCYCFLSLLWRLIVFTRSVYTVYGYHSVAIVSGLREPLSPWQRKSGTAEALPKELTELKHVLTLKIVWRTLKNHSESVLLNYKWETHRNVTVCHSHKHKLSVLWKQTAS